MAFFKKRKEGVDHPASAAPPESVEVLRKRAKHRLIGTAILVLVAVIGFPLLVDKQPRPGEFNIPIVIADKGKTQSQPQPAPLAPVAAPAPVVPALAAAPKVAAPAPIPVASSGVPRADLPALSSPVPAPVPVAKAAPVPEKKVATAPVVPAASEERFVVQVGAYAEQTRAREARLKLERAGIKTYTQVVENKEGRRIRVRAGPFTSRAQAEREAEKIKKLDLPASVLTL
jgi:DedD protein